MGSARLALRSSRPGIEQKHFRAAAGEVPHVGRGGLAFGAAERALNCGEIVEGQRRHQLIGGRAGGCRDRAAAHFVFSQTRDLLGDRNVLFGIMLVECGGVFRCFVHDDELSHRRFSLVVSLFERTATRSTRQRLRAACNYCEPNHRDNDEEISYSAAAASLSRRPISARPVALTVHPRVTLPMPPSTTMSWPLTKLEASLARNTAARAISSGRPARGIGCSVAKATLRRSVTLSAFDPSMPAFLAKMPVTMPPGISALTRMPFSPSSAAAERDSACTAPLVAE